MFNTFVVCTIHIDILNVYYLLLIGTCKFSLSVRDYIPEPKNVWLHFQICFVSSKWIHANFKKNTFCANGIILLFDKFLIKRKHVNWKNCTNFYIYIAPNNWKQVTCELLLCIFCIERCEDVTVWSCLCCWILIPSINLLCKLILCIDQPLIDGHEIIILQN